MTITEKKLLPTKGPHHSITLIGFEKMRLKEVFIIEKSLRLSLRALGLEQEYNPKKETKQELEYIEGLLEVINKLTNPYNF